MNRPKRKKSKDNPYTLLVINNKYYVEFKDVKNILNTVEVTEEQFEAFNEFELEDKSQMNKDERHKERLEVYEETLYKRANLIYGSVEDDFIKKSRYEDLMKAINELPKTIKRRIKMFYFEELTTSQIATLEHCSDRMIRKSLEQDISEEAKEMLFNIYINYLANKDELSIINDKIKIVEGEIF